MASLQEILYHNMYKKYHDIVLHTVPGMFGFKNAFLNPCINLINKLLPAKTFLKRFCPYPERFRVTAYRQILEQSSPEELSMHEYCPNIFFSLSFSLRSLFRVRSFKRMLVRVHVVQGLLYVAEQPARGPRAGSERSGTL